MDFSAFSAGLADAVARAGAAVVAVHGRIRTQSSGLHWRAGLVVTAEHTLRRDDDLGVSLPDGRTVAATLVGRDPGTDLAVLRIDAEGVLLAERHDEARVGSLILAVARNAEEGLGASFGVVSAHSGPWRTWRGGDVERFLQPDLTLYPGFSGGPLVDAEGRVLGINTSGLTRRYPVTLPGVTVDRVVDLILARGTAARGYLGLGMQAVQLPEKHGARTAVMILSVEEGGPADQAGVLLGDVLLSVAGETVSDTDDVQRVMAGISAGTATRLELLRAGEPLGKDVTVGERPRRDACG
ncbi:MAG: serine protease [Armatimonadetes bacterium]|nr:serine protease [Armatimonadota bacterium]